MSHDGTSSPFPSLSGEHELLTACLASIEVLADRLEAVEHESPEELELVRDLGRFVNFLNEFGESIHHVKEEDVLLPALAKAGFSWDQGPLAHVRKDHDQERYLVRVLEQAASQEGGWSREDGRHAVATVRGFVAFLREHMRKEDATLMPVIATRLSAEQIQEIDRALEAFDAKHLPEGKRDTFAADIEALAAKYRA